MRLGAAHTLRGHRPFATRGVSLYVASGATVPDPDAIVYRLQTLAAPGMLHGSRTSPGGTGTAKTGRVAFVAHPATTLSYSLPASLAGKKVRVQLRTCESDIENESIWRTMLVDLDADRVEVVGFEGTGTLLSVEPRAGGVCRVRFRYEPSVSGLQPASFGYAFVSGGGVTAAIAPSYDPRRQYYELDLTCTASTVVDVTAIAGATTRVLFRCTLVPDATGPTAPSGLIGSAV